ncbi:hypothetical protein Q9Q94_10315 [Uliginosibacterium sp. 31-16]|uniref:hypothetical protein n=1 Tax=Uliginosibacterium sp. 31-16 TaxID=3068315 RepID=UPI00273D845C|nr:hypothetical protein [Uliginosibacterium sp. 31-16]MDP5239929.1 hypothetical protein [Uliginosibacterium sp. 31-16]
MAYATATYLAIAAIAAAAASAYASTEAAKTNTHNAKIAAENQAYEGHLQNDLNDLAASDAMRSAQIEADKIKAQAMAMRGAQASQAAASGLVVGAGSAQIMSDKTTDLATSDALAALYSGIDKAWQYKTEGEMAVVSSTNRARAMQVEARAHQSATNWQAGISLLSSAASSYGLYEKSTTAKTTTTTTT